MSEFDEYPALPNENFSKLVESATNPAAFFRRGICRRLVHQINNQFGVEGLYDLLTGIDEVGKFASVVVIDRDEVDNYLFEEHGVFDPDMFEKVQLSDKWSDFLSSIMTQTGDTLGEIIDEEIRRD